MRGPGADAEQKRSKFETRDKRKRLVGEDQEKWVF